MFKRKIQPLLTILVLTFVLLMPGFRYSANEAAQDVLWWATHEGEIFNYFPESQTLLEHQLPFSINPYSINRLSSNHYLLHNAEDETYHIIDIQSADVLCSIAEEISDWHQSPVQDDALLIYQTSATQTTEIISLNWRSCQQNILVSFPGEFRAASPAYGTDFVALSTYDNDGMKFHVLNLLTSDLTTLDVPLEDSQFSHPYWTQDNRSVLVQNDDERYLYTPSTSSIERLEDISGAVQAVSAAPLLLRSGVHAELSTQFWQFEHGQAMELLFEIENESYDHMPGFSPDFAYYAFRDSSRPDTVQIYDWRNDNLSEIDAPEALRRWSPDLEWMAFFLREEEEVRLYHVESGLEQSYEGYINWLTERAWSNDGRFVSFWQSDGEAEHLMLVNIAQGSTRRLYSRTIMEGFTGSAYWSPGDRYIAIESVEFLEDTQQFISCYYLVDVETASIQSPGCGNSGLYWTVFDAN